MSPFLSRLRALFRGLTSSSHNTRPLTQVAIIGLLGAGQRTILEHLSETPIRPFILQGQHHIAEEGSSPSLGLALRMVDVGGDAPGRWHVLTAQSYADVDALIVAVDVADPITLDELRQELGRVVRGRHVQGWTEPFPVAKQGIPWLVLVMFKGEVVVSMESLFFSLLLLCSFFFIKSKFLLSQF